MAKVLLGNLKTFLGFGSSNANKNVVTDDNGDLKIENKNNHSHGQIDKDGKVGSSSGKPLITTTDGAVTTGAFGTSSGQFAEGNHTHSISDVTNLQTSLNGKVDVGDAVTSISLVPKGNDPTADAYNGVIRLYYGDEPSS